MQYQDEHVLATATLRGGVDGGLVQLEIDQISSEFNGAARIPNPRKHSG